MWSPISLDQLYEQIFKTETQLNGELWNFWQMIKIDPEKWQEQKYGKEGGGFWVVAICGRQIIWYNDIEEGFNISKYTTYGEIEEYWCNQSELNDTVISVYDQIKFGQGIIGQASGPYNL